MATWLDVERVGRTLPEATRGEAHEGSPAMLVRTRQFARLRWDEAGYEILQFWVSDADIVAAHVHDDPVTFTAMPGYSRKVVMAKLRRLDDQMLRELLVESWACRAPKSLSKAHRDLC